MILPLHLQTLHHGFTLAGFSIVKVAGHPSPPLKRRFAAASSRIERKRNPGAAFQRVDRPPGLAALNSGYILVGPLSVAAVEQSPGDDLRLDFRGALENIEDAGVAQNPRHRKFERKAVAAVDLHGVVGGGPGDARRQELRHAGLEVAAPAGILLPRRIIGELARDHDLDRHHGDLVGDAREIGDRLAELHARERIAAAPVPAPIAPRRWRAPRSGCARIRKSPSAA